MVKRTRESDKKAGAESASDSSTSIILSTKRSKLEPSQKQASKSTSTPQAPIEKAPKTSQESKKEKSKVFEFEENSEDIFLNDSDPRSLTPIGDVTEADLLKTTISIEKKKESEEDSCDSDKFYSQMKEIEEKSVGSSSRTDKSDSKKERSGVSSDTESHFDSFELPKGWLEKKVHVYLKVVDPLKNVMILEPRNFHSTIDRVYSFLKLHNIDITASSSGYHADTSSPEPVELGENGFKGLQQQQRQVSLGSTIPRASTSTTIYRPSIFSSVEGEDEEEKTTTTGRGGKMRKNRNEAPLLSSTKITDVSQLDKPSTTTTTREKKKIKSNTSITTTTPKSTPLNNNDINENIEHGKGKGNINKSLSESSSIDSLSSSTSSSRLSASERSRAEQVKIKVEPLEPGSEKRVGRPKFFGNASQASVDEFNHPDFIKSATLWGSIAIDEAVFARWRDRSYYSGKITQKGMNDTWAIHFEDGIDDVASETHILPIEILGVGIWTVYCPSNVFKPENAIIVGQRFTEQKEDDMERVEYAIASDTDGRIIYCHRKNLSLAETDAKELRKKFQVPTPLKAADVSLDNIVSGPRTRPPPTPSTVIRQLVADAFDMSSSNDDGTLSKTPDSKITSVKQEPESPRKPNENSSGGGRKKGGVGGVTHFKTPTRKLSETSTTTTPASSSPPTTPASSKTRKKVEATKPKLIFLGMEFLLTGATLPVPEGLPPTTNKDPYQKDDIRELLVLHGGTCHDVVEEEDPENEHVYLISDNCARTVKYVYALAAGIPCVSHQWILDSVSANEVLDYKEYQFCSGISIETGAIINAHQNKPLKGVRIYVTSHSEELLNYWKPVLNAAEAVCLRIRPKGKSSLIPPETEIIVTNDGYSDELIAEARERSIPYVKPEWLVQTLICGRKVPFDAHENYVVGEVTLPPHLIEEEEDEEDEED